jgi:pSer/pThr/pTyr-binding forkhead associated (FHA) protein
MRAELVFIRNGSEQRFELSAGTATIGRSADCELPIADDRISTRHCRFTERDDAWQLEDLKSTNRTFVNGEPLDGQPRRLRHGDIVRLGARDARLFEARFVIHAQSDTPTSAHRAAAREVATGIHRELTSLQALLAARNDEIARLGSLVKRVQAQLAESDAAAVATRRASSMMTAELDDLRGQLATERTEHAASRDEIERTRRRCSELEAQLDTQARKARRDLDDGERSRKDLESQLRMASSELAITKASLATATDNVRTLKQAHDDAQLQIELGTEDARSRAPR